MTGIFRSELLKLRKSPIWTLVLVSPVLSTLVGLMSPVESGMNPWIQSLTFMVMLHGLLFLPLLAGIFAAFVCRYEHAGGGWKQLLALPVTRKSVYFVKFGIVLGLLAITQLLFFAGLMAVGVIKVYEEPIPWETILQCALGGWAACLPLAALQLAVSVVWSSFAAPLAVNVIFTLPNILVANSETYASYYPWVQPFLAMIPPSMGGFGEFVVPLDTLFLVIFVSFSVFFASGLAYFTRKAV